MRIKKSKLVARDEVNSLLSFLRDYSRAKRGSAMALIRELRLAIRQANHGQSGELEDGSEDYCPSLAEGDVLLAILNMVERDFGIKVSSLDRVGRCDWEILDHVEKKVEHSDECKAIQPMLSGTDTSGCHANCPVAKAKGGA
jgi:hypothetical protein